MMTNFSFLGGRTFLLTVGCLIVMSVMRWFDKLSNEGFTAIILASVCAYIAKTAVERHSEIKAEAQKAMAGVETQPSELGKQ